MKVRALSGGQVHAIDDRRDLIRAGGEGGVYQLRNEPFLVAKIYHDPAGRRPKLEAMLRNPPIDDATPDHKSIAWPTDILVDAGNAKKFLGFMMPKVGRASGFHDFSNPARREKQYPRFTFRDLHVVASNTASAFWALHQKGYVIGDVNEGNLLIRDDALATVVDTDSFQVRAPDGTVFRCKVGREEFTPPELQNANSLGEFDREVVHDAFGLGVLLFQLLMQGFHPYSGSPAFQGEAWPLGRRIAEGNFPWDGSSAPFKVPPHAPRLEVLDPRLQKLFIDTFSRSRIRPNASTWKRELDGAIERLRKCGSVRSHAYGKHLSSCPWCERDAQLASMPKKAAPKPAISVPSLPRQVYVSRPSISRSAPTFSPNGFRPKLPSLLSQPPAKVPSFAVAEITPGNWRLHPADPMVRLLSAFAASDEFYELRADGRCNVSGTTNLMGNRCEFTADGRWSYEPFTKLLSIDGTFTSRKFNDPWMAIFAQAMPVQPLSARLTVVNRNPDGVTLRDHRNGANFLFERL